MKRVFLVSCGEYSDYVVDCVCTDGAVAEEVARRLSAGYQNSPKFQTPRYLYKHHVEELEVGLLETMDDVDVFLPTPTATLDPEGT